MAEKLSGDGLVARGAGKVAGGIASVRGAAGRSSGRQTAIDGSWTGAFGARGEIMASWAGFNQSVAQWMNFFGDILTAFKTGGFKAAADVFLGRAETQSAEILDMHKEGKDVPDDPSASVAPSNTDISQGATLGVGVAAIQKMSPAFASATARLGAKAIPVVGTVVSGYETVTDSVGHALKGEWGNAATRLVGGAVESAGYFFGATPLVGTFTMAAGNMANEGIRYAAVKSGLADDGVQHSTAGSIINGAANWLQPKPSGMN